MTWLRVLPLLAVACGDPASGSAGDSSAGDTTATAATHGTSDESGGANGGANGAESGMSESSEGSGSTAGSDACATVLGSGDAPIYARTEGVFTLRSFPGYTTLQGQVGAAPQPDFHTEAAREGSCRLLRYAGEPCTPECLAPSLCVDGACIDLPSFVSAGEMTLEGVGDRPVDVIEDGVHQYFWDTVGDPTFTMPRLVAAGGDVEAFDLSVCPVTAPSPTDDWAARLEARAPGEDVTLTWSDPIETARVYLRMTTGIGTHGGISPVELECEGPDQGVLVLPGAFLDALYAEGWSCGECGGNDLVRYHADRTGPAAPTIDFRVTASTGFWHIP